MEIESYLTDVYGPRLTGSPEHQGSGRLDHEDDEGVGPDERAPGDVAVRPRLAESALHGERGDAARLSAHRVSQGVDARHQRSGHRRRGHRGDQRREGLRRRSAASCAASSCCRWRCARCRRISSRRARATRTPSSQDLAKQPAAGAAADAATSTPAQEFNRKKTQFWIDEGVAAVLDFSRGDDGTVFVQSPQGVSRDPKGPAQPAQVTLGDRALRPHLAHAREEDSRHAADGHRQQVLSTPTRTPSTSSPSCRAPTRPTRS